MSEEELEHKATKLAEKYSRDNSSEDLLHEMNPTTMFHNVHFGKNQLGLLELDRIQIIKNFS